MYPGHVREDGGPPLVTSARVHARNLLANWVGHGANLVVMFFLSPFVIHTLGPTEYGIWSLLNVLAGYMGIMDLGVRASTGRHIILYLGKGDHHAVDRTVRTGLGFYSVVGLVVLLAGVALGWVFPTFFRSVPESYHGLVRFLLPLMALNLWLSAWASVCSSVLTAHERFDLARGIDFAILAARTVGTVLVLRWGFALPGLVMVVLACNILALACNRALARRIYPRLRLWPLSLDRVRVRELLGYGIGAFVSSISLTIIGQTDLVVAGAAIGVSAVTVYSVGAMLVYYSQTFLRHINATLFPSIQKAVARGETGSTRWLFLRAGRLAMLFGVLVYTGLIVFAGPFIRLWMHGPKFGDESVRQAATVMGILAATKLPLLFVGASRFVLNAMGYVRLTAAIVALEAVLNLGLSLVFVLILNWGLAGIAGGTLAARLLVGTFIVPWHACRRLGMSWWRYVVRQGGIELLACSVTLALFLAIRGLLPAASWGWFALQVASAAAGYSVIAWFVLVPAEDRSRVLTRLRRGGSVRAVPSGETKLDKVAP